MFLFSSRYLFLLFFCWILGYQNLSGVPVVTSVSPTNGPVAGGNVVTISGSGFTGATNVDFGFRPGLVFLVVDDSTISATVPAGTPGTVNVIVTAAGQSTTSPNDYYTYTDIGWKGIISSITPNQVALFSTTTNTFDPPIPMSSTSMSSVITPDGAFIYTGNSGPPSITVIDVATSTMIATIPNPVSGDGAFDIVVNPSGTRVYLSNNVSGYVTVLDTTNNTIVTNIFIEPNIGPLSVTPDGSTVYVSAFSSGTIIPIDTATNTVGTSIPVGLFPGKVSITPDGKKAFIPIFFNGTVLVMDVATQTITNIIPLASPFSGPYGSSLLPNGTKLYIANITENSLSVIDVASETLTTTIPLPPANVNSFWVVATPDSQKVYVINETNNFVTEIDTLSDTVSDSFNGVAGDFRDLVISPDPAPVASFTATPQLAGSPTSFDASASLSPIGTIVSYAWDFGDGTTVTTASSLINHTYTHAGNFTVTLTVTNSAGTSTTQVFSSGFMSNNGGPTAVISHIVSTLQGPPSNAKGIQKTCQYPSQTDYVNVLTWNPAAGRPAFYEIYRDSLTNLIGTVPGTGPLVFRDPNRKKNTTYTYYIVAVSASGARSDPIIVTINPRIKV